MYAFLVPKKITHLLSACIFSLLVLAISLLYVPPISAQESAYSPAIATSSQPIPSTVHNNAQVALVELLSAFMCQLTGKDPTTADQQCIGYSSFGKLGYVNNKNLGALGMISNAVDTVYNNIPIHTKDYIAYLSNNFGFVHKTYAAGGTASTGYQSLSPLLGIWVVMRNIAYLLIVLIFIFIGFAVMLRVKIDPRTVMTIENQIPKIIIGLILITFSFAIAGLLIDLMYILMYVFYNIYASIPNINKELLTPQIIQNSSTFDVINYMFPPGFLGVSGSGIVGLTNTAAFAFGDVFKHVIGFDNASWNPIDFNNGPFSTAGGISSLFHFNLFSFAVDFVSWMLALKMAAIAAPLGAQAAGGFADLFPGVSTATGAAAAILAGGLTYYVVESFGRTMLPYILVWVIIYIALFLALAKLLFSLITAWVTILYHIVLAPLFIFFGLIPGVEAGFSSWLKNLVANLFTFPLTAAILMIGSAIVQALGSATGAVFVPPFIGGGSLPIGVLLGVVIIFVASNSPQIAKDMFKIKEDKNTGAFGTFMGTGLSTVITGAKASYSAFGKTVKPGERGGLQAAIGQLPMPR